MEYIIGVIFIIAFFGLQAAIIFKCIDKIAEAIVNSENDIKKEFSENPAEQENVL